MAQSKFRVGGGYTTINFNGAPLLFVDLVRESAPRPVAAPQPIQPLDHPYPIEIALPAAIEAGTLEITLREQWNAEVWAYLPGNAFATASDLLDVFKAQLSTGSLGQDWTVTKNIKDPTGNIVRTITYTGIVITNVMVDESVQISTMTFPKSIQMMYLRRYETQNPTSATTSVTVSGNI